MGKLASIVDWSREESHSVPRGFESGVCMTAPAEDDFDDEPTRPFLRVVPLAAPSPTVEVDRTSELAIARLRSLAEWLTEEEGATPVVAFVRRFLEHVAELDFVVRLLKEKSGETSGLGAAANAFYSAASVWRANLVDYVDDLALTEYRSLAGWTSLPEYSSMYVLACIAPTLATLKDAISATRREEGGVDLLPCVWAIEATVVRLNWMLAGVSSRGIEDAVSRRTMPAVGW